MAALARGFSDRHFERGEGPGDKVGSGLHIQQIGLVTVSSVKGRNLFPNLKPPFSENRWAVKTWFVVGAHCTVSSARAV